MERSKIRDTDNTRTFFLARFFIEYLLVLKQKHADAKGKGIANGHSEDVPLGLVAEMAELDSVRFLFGRMRLTMDGRVRRCQIPSQLLTGLKPPAWTELQACLDCFTQVVRFLETSS